MVRTSITAGALVILGGTAGLWAGGKPDPTPDWRCKITLHDASLDTIKSDDGGAYVDGVGGVTCKVINEPGATQDRWLFMSITGTRHDPVTRFIRYIGQTNAAGATYQSFANHGTFEVLGLGKVGWNPNGPTPRDVMPFRAYLRRTYSLPQLPDLPFVDGLATVDGDSNLSGSFKFGADDPTSSVFVHPVDQCSWDVTSDPMEDVDYSREQADTHFSPRVMRMTEGAFDLVHHATLRGDFPMPFGATVTIVANKPGCSQP